MRRSLELDLGAPRGSRPRPPPADRAEETLCSELQKGMQLWEEAVFTSHARRLGRKEISRSVYLQSRFEYNSDNGSPNGMLSLH